MKRTILLSALVLSVFASCKKLNDVLPENNIPENNETTQPISAEDSKILITLPTTPMVYNPAEQVITGSVEGTQLNLAFNEKVQLLIDKERYSKTWYILFQEDFSATSLKGWDYKTILPWGTPSENWQPANLNQMDKTVTDTTIGGKKVVNVKFERNFTFYKKYDTAEEATAKLNSLAGKKEIVKFLTRYEPDADTTRFYTSSVKIVYKK